MTGLRPEKALVAVGLALVAGVLAVLVFARAARPDPEAVDAVVASAPRAPPPQVPGPTAAPPVQSGAPSDAFTAPRRVGALTPDRLVPMPVEALSPPGPVLDAPGERAQGADWDAIDWTGGEGFVDGEWFGTPNADYWDPAVQAP